MGLVRRRERATAIVAENPEVRVHEETKSSRVEDTRGERRFLG